MGRSLSQSDYVETILNVECELTIPPATSLGTIPSELAEGSDRNEVANFLLAFHFV